MFESWGPWAWVAAAWFELAAAYALYLTYLTWRARRAVRREDPS